MTTTERDFRFEITEVPEPEMGCTHLVVVIEHGTEIELERFTTDNPWGAVEAAREAQAIPLEERLDMYAERGW